MLVSVSPRRAKPFSRAKRPERADRAARPDNGGRWMKYVRLKQIAVGAMALAGVAWMATPGVSSASSSDHAAIPHYQHVVEIMMENTSYQTIIGNSNAPQINALASKYGLATNSYGVTDPSEPNYVANVGGSFFGIQDDNQFYCTPAMATTDPTCAGTTVNHTVSAPNIATQLTA